MKKIPSLAASLAAALVVAGCSAGTTEVTKEQEKAFDGGPMPAAAREKMAQGLAGAREGASNAAEEARRKAMSGGGN